MMKTHLLCTKRILKVTRMVRWTRLNLMNLRQTCEAIQKKVRQTHLSCLKNQMSVSLSALRTCHWQDRGGP